MITERINEHNFAFDVLKADVLMTVQERITKAVNEATKAVNEAINERIKRENKQTEEVQERITKAVNEAINESKKRESKLKEEVSARDRLIAELHEKLAKTQDEQYKVPDDIKYKKGGLKFDASFHEPD